MQSFETVTALTLGGIIAILTLYFLVVYKKGWLKKESKTNQAYYLCPSQKCRRVFKKPVWLTDLSRTPPESYQACPHCGMNVQAVSPSSPVTPVSDATVKPSIAPGGIRSSRDRLRFTRRKVMSGKSGQGSESTKPSLQTSGSTGHPPSEEEQAYKPVFHFPQIRKDTQKPESPKRSGEKGSVESQRKCSHFFGYVKTLPKNTPIPDECLWCPSIVDCLSYEQKVEAEA